MTFGGLTVSVQFNLYIQWSQLQMTCELTCKILIISKDTYLVDIAAQQAG